MRLLPVLVICSAFAGGAVLSAETASLGGDTSRAARGLAAFSLPAANLTFEETERFFRGFLLFHRPWGETPGPEQAGSGLGPLHNATSCGACHLNDGRGPAPQAGSPVTAATLQIARQGAEGWGPHPTLGGQLQPLSTTGPGEGTVSVTWEEVQGRYTDGRLYRLRRPLIAVGGADLDPRDSLSLRLAPGLAGLGLLEALPEETLRALEAEGPGRLRRLPSDAPGRFGWKGGSAAIADQVALAAREDLGLTSPTFPGDRDEAELSGEGLDDLVFYSRTLAVPLAEGLPAQGRGAALFAELGCAACHRPRLRTGRHALAALSNQEIRPFTDLLLHDMGPGLADRRLDGGTSADPLARLWRTPPLWGLGKVRQVAGETALLHDGRARSPAEAILWHGGEAEEARAAFLALDLAEREALLAFLAAL